MMTELTAPSVGHIVHYAQPGAQCVAAIVTQVHSDQDGPVAAVALQAFWPPFVTPVPEGSLNFVRQDETRADQVSATWHWPERV
jgi:hypothetical protein